MFAVDQAAIFIESIAVDEVRSVYDDLDATVGIPSEHAPICDVGPDEAIACALPHRPFSVQGTFVEPQQR